MQRQNQQQEKGFTIIEVMIVLVIAAVILLIVFLAVPALQRNSRNNQRKNDAARLVALMNEQKTNNNNNTPTHLRCSGIPRPSHFIDLENEEFSFYNCNEISITSQHGHATNTTSLIVRVGYSCDPDSSAESWRTVYLPSTSPNDFIVVYHAETGNGTKAQCIEG
jgi:prepilin-type N-terminal cleavage/methylation domain-containing protein